MPRRLLNTPRVRIKEPAMEEYVFCVRCRDDVYDYCDIHGPLLVVPDDKVPENSPFPPYVPRSVQTIPGQILYIDTSIIPDAGVGVFARLPLPIGVRFGPYRGKKTTEINSHYCWKIYDRNNKFSHVVDAGDSKDSNWMRYVNCSRHYCEQNLVAYQYEGEVYYRTIKRIPRFTELMVFYGAKFADLLHVDLRAYNSPARYRQVLEEAERSRLLIGTPRALTTSKDPTSKESAVEDEKTDQLDLKKEQDKSLKNKANKPETNTDANSNIGVNNNSGDITEPTIKKQKYTESNIGNKHVTKQSTQVNTIFLQNDLLCEICDYKSQTKTHLEKHLILHTLDKNVFKCNECGYMTQKKYGLTAHIKTHTSRQRFSCTLCDYKCATSSNLNVHQRTHNGRKPFHCKICEYKSSSSSNMKVHLRTHTGEKPYKCNICDFKSSHNRTLKSHIKSKHSA